MYQLYNCHIQLVRLPLQIVNYRYHQLQCLFLSSKEGKDNSILSVLWNSLFISVNGELWNCFLHLCKKQWWTLYCHLKFSSLSKILNCRNHHLQMVYSPLKKYWTLYCHLACKFSSLQIVNLRNCNNARCVDLCKTSELYMGIVIRDSLFTSANSELLKLTCKWFVHLCKN